MERYQTYHVEKNGLGSGQVETYTLKEIETCHCSRCCRRWEIPGVIEILHCIGIHWHNILIFSLYSQKALVTFMQKSKITHMESIGIYLWVHVRRFSYRGMLKTTYSWDVWSDWREHINLLLFLSKCEGGFNDAWHLTPWVTKTTHPSMLSSIHTNVT